MVIHQSETFTILKNEIRAYAAGYASAEKRRDNALHDFSWKEAGSANMELLAFRSGIMALGAVYREMIRANARELDKMALHYQER